MYYKYWGLEKPPFDNVPDTTMYAECHASMESAIAETLFAIEEGGECISVIIGDVGLGKTMSIRMIIDSLNQEKYKIALITNPSTTFVQLMREIIGQLTGKLCEEKKKANLLEMFNKLLFETVDEGKKVLVFIDEANVISPSNLENLRLLTNMQDDQRNLFTMVLAGQLELARRLEHPKFSNLFQRIGTYNKIEKIQSEDLVKAYVETRLRLAGGKRNIFTDDAFGVLWKYSEYGVPRLINKIGKLSLKAGETNGFDVINGEVVRQIGERFQKTTGPAMQKRMPRKKPKGEMPPEEIAEMEYVRNEAITDQDSEQVVSGADTLNPAVTAFPQGDKVFKKEEIPDNGEKIESFPKKSDTKERVVSHGKNGLIKAEDLAEAKIGDYRVMIKLPPELLREAHSSTPEHRMKLAGIMAAQALKENPQLTKSLSIDPVSIWGEIRDIVLRKIG
jgi:general secretion pathway protein A